MDREVSIQAIARIRNDFTDKFGIPRQSGLAEELESLIIFEEPFRDAQALRGIEGYSHLWLIWHFSANADAGWHPTVRPPRLHFLSTHGEKSLYACRFAPGDALVFGSESSGLPADFYARYRDALFRIPMPGVHARSINLANAVSIAAYECYRQLAATGTKGRNRADG